MRSTHLDSSRRTFQNPTIYTSNGPTYYSHIFHYATVITIIKKTHKMQAPLFFCLKFRLYSRDETLILTPNRNFHFMIS